MYTNRIGDACSLFYMGWAWLAEYTGTNILRAYCCNILLLFTGNYPKADEIYRRGIDRRAEPLDRIKVRLQTHGFCNIKLIVNIAVLSSPFPSSHVSPLETVYGRRVSNAMLRPS